MAILTAKIAGARRGCGDRLPVALGTAAKPLASCRLPQLLRDACLHNLPLRYAHEQGLQDANMFASDNNPDGRFRPTPARTKRIDEIFKQKLRAEEQSGLRAADAAKAIGPETPAGTTRPIARLQKRGRIDTLVVDLLSGSPKKRKQRAEELAESCESRDELRRHGERVAAMKKRGGVLSRNDRAVIRLVRLLL